MAQILFNKNIDLSGFNMGSSDIDYPISQDDPLSIEDATEKSIVYSFVNTLLCDDGVLYGRYKSQTLSRDRFIVYKQVLGNDIKTYVATISGITDGFYDYNINNKDKYKYIVETNPVDINGDAPSVSLETEYYLNPHWNYWSICDIEKNYDVSAESGAEIYVPSDTVFIMKNNLNIGAISDNLNIIKYNTLGRFGKTITNSQKYDSGNISCLIADMQGYQNIKYGDKVFTVNNLEIKNENDIDLFFCNLKNIYYDADQRFDGQYFMFPAVSKQYYRYDVNSVKIIYVLQTQKPDQWESNFNEYYIWDKHNANYISISPSYSILDKKPSDWDEKYMEYYIQDVPDGGIGDTTEDIVNVNYILNTDSVFVENHYYKAEVPNWSDTEKYYIKAICCGTKVKSHNVFMNTFDTLQAWRDCLSNGKLKLLKAPNGQSWVVTISEPTQLNVEWRAQKYPASIDFSWQEVLDKDKISIIKW